MSNVQITKWHKNVTIDKLNVKKLAWFSDSLKSSAHSLSPGWLRAIWKSDYKEVKVSVHPTPQGNTSWCIWGDYPCFPPGWGVQMTGAFRYRSLLDNEIICMLSLLLCWRMMTKDSSLASIVSSTNVELTIDSLGIDCKPFIKGISEH